MAFVNPNNALHTAYHNVGASSVGMTQLIRAPRTIQQQSSSSSHPLSNVSCVVFVIFMILSGSSREPNDTRVVADNLSNSIPDPCSTTSTYIPAPTQCTEGPEENKNTPNSVVSYRAELVSHHDRRCFYFDGQDKNENRVQCSRFRSDGLALAPVFARGSGGSAGAGASLIIVSLGVDGLLSDPGAGLP